MGFLDKIIAFFKRKDNMLLWQQFAQVKQGELKSSSGDLFVAYRYADFKFQIGAFTHYVTSGTNTYEYKYLIGIVLVTNPAHFELAISPDDLFAKMGKLFKNDEITIGNKSFDSKFLIKSNHKLKAITLLNHKALREIITAANPTLLEITKEQGLFAEHHPPEGQHMLYYAKQEKCKAINQLHLIHLLLATFIDNLKENGVIQN